MEPLAIVAFTGGLIAQIGIIVLRFQPAFALVARVVECFRHPRPPPPLTYTAESIFRAAEELNSHRHA